VALRFAESGDDRHWQRPFLCLDMQGVFDNGTIYLRDAHLYGFRMAYTVLHSYRIAGTRGVRSAGNLSSTSAPPSVDLPSRTE
jgi:hypothetical protein